MQLYFRQFHIYCLSSAMTFIMICPPLFSPQSQRPQSTTVIYIQATAGAGGSTLTTLAVNVILTLCCSAQRPPVYGRHLVSLRNRDKMSWITSA